MRNNHIRLFISVTLAISLVGFFLIPHPSHGKQTNVGRLQKLVGPGFLYTHESRIYLAFGGAVAKALQPLTVSHPHQFNFLCTPVGFKKPLCLTRVAPAGQLVPYMVSRKISNEENLDQFINEMEAQRFYVEAEQEEGAWKLKFTGRAVLSIKEAINRKTNSIQPMINLQYYNYGYLIVDFLSRIRGPLPEQALIHAVLTQDNFEVKRLIEEEGAHINDFVEDPFSLEKVIPAAMVYNISKFENTFIESIFCDHGAKIYFKNEFEEGYYKPFYCYEH